MNKHLFKLVIVLVATFVYNTQANFITALATYNAHKRQEYGDAWMSYFNHVKANFVEEEKKQEEPEEKKSSPNIDSLSDLQNCPEKTLHMLRLLQHCKSHGPSDIDPRGILFHGPPGTGKTTMAKLLAHDAGLEHEYILGADFFNKYSGEGRQAVQDLFTRLRALKRPVVLIVDEIDAIGAASTQGVHQEYQAIAQRFWNELSDQKNNSIFVVGITNHYHKLDDAFKRNGRFDEHIEIKLPQTDQERENIILFYLNKAGIVLEDAAIKNLARITPGYSGQDIATIVKKARQRVRIEGAAPAENYLVRVFNEEIEQRRAAVEQVLNSGPYYYPIRTPQITSNQNIPSWDPEPICQLIRIFKNPEPYRTLCKEEYRAANDCIVPGLLLYGPPGNGKTLMAEAFAGEIGAKFISVTASEFNRKYAGEGSRHIEALFQRAHAYVKQNPMERVIIFIDEIDAIGCKRTDGDVKGASGAMITLFDKMNELKGDSIFVIAATNRDKILDEALMRRFRTQVAMNNPDENNRKRILAYYLKRKKQIVISGNPFVFGQEDGTQERGAGFLKLVQDTKDFACSDLKELVDRALIFAGDQRVDMITMQHFEQALPLVKEARLNRLNRAETDSEFQRRMALLQYRIAQQQRNMGLVGTVLNSIAQGGQIGAAVGLGAGGPPGAAAGGAIGVGAGLVVGLASAFGSYQATSDVSEPHR
jgi:ATP-dependent 26S proteasome regulatory subunit